MFVTAFYNNFERRSWFSLTQAWRSRKSNFSVPTAAPSCLSGQNKDTARLHYPSFDSERRLALVKLISTIPRSKVFFEVVIRIPINIPFALRTSHNSTFKPMFLKSIKRYYNTQILVSQEKFVNKLPQKNFDSFPYCFLSSIHMPSWG